MEERFFNHFNVLITCRGYGDICAASFISAYRAINRAALGESGDPPVFFGGEARIHPCLLAGKK